MRQVFWGSAAIYAATLVVLWFLLPADGVVLHSGPSGPDRWGSRLELIVVMALVGAGIAALFGVIARHLTRRQDLTSPVVNLPHKDWWTATPERARRAKAMLTDGLYGIGAGTMVFMSVLTMLVQFADTWITLVVVGTYLAAVLAWCAHIAARRYRPVDAG